jgi:hypothetical protein
MMQGTVEYEVMLMKSIREFSASILDAGTE